MGKLRRRYDLMNIVIPVNQPLMPHDDQKVQAVSEIEYTRARLDFTARTVELPTKTLSFVDVRALWKAIVHYGDLGA